MTGGHHNGKPPPAVDVDRYEVDSVVGRGGMGTVYRARQVGLNRTVALKILHDELHSDATEDFVKRFRREAETLAKFDHPNIVRIHDLGTTRSGRPFLAMEFVEGPRLSDLVRDVPMSARELLPLILQVCEGLRYAHDRGAVHRDLKPGNLLVKELAGGRRQIKIVDFGVVKLVDEEQTITREGLILGSPHYMAPEQLRGEPVDHRVDIYALGALLFRCLSGRYPFQRNNLAATMLGHLNDAVPRLSKAAPNVELPEGLDEVVERCMQKLPEDRFQSVDEVAERLRLISGLTEESRRPSSPTHLQVPTASSNQERPRRKRRLSAVLVALGVGMVLGGALLATSLPLDEGPPERTIDAAPIEAEANRAEQVPSFERPPDVVVEPLNDVPPPEDPALREEPPDAPTPAVPERGEAAPEALDPHPLEETPEGYFGLPEDL